MKSQHSFPCNFLVRYWPRSLQHLFVWSWVKTCLPLLITVMISSCFLFWKTWWNKHTIRKVVTDVRGSRKALIRRIFVIKDSSWLTWTFLSKSLDSSLISNCQLKCKWKNWLFTLLPVVSHELTTVLSIKWQHTTRRVTVILETTLKC